MIPKKLKPVLMRVPGVGPALKARWFRQTFPNEYRLLHAGPAGGSREQSVVFFTLHKCGSVYASNIIRQCAEARRLTPVDFDGYFYLGGPSPLDVFAPDPRQIKTYPKTGYYFGPFRHFNPAIPQLDDFRILLMLRDPRDVLTSLYFSIAYSHYVPEENPKEAQFLLNRRADALKKSIDEFVLEEAPTFAERYEIYHRELMAKPNCLSVKYEEMVGSFESWVQRIATFMGLDMDSPLIESARAEQREENRIEDVRSHKRQITPGDHRKKLQPQTISALNSICARSLELFGYSEAGE